MPTYEYACSSCGHRFDVRQSFNDAPVTDCRQCGASVRRVLFPSGVIFKGSGWYKTDSRKEPASHSAASTESSPKDSRGETKPATEPEKDGAKSSLTPKKDVVKTAADD